MNPPIEQLLSRMALALGIGLLIGLERGWRSREAAPGSRTAGTRTFAVTGLLGGIFGALALRDDLRGTGGAILLAASFAAYTFAITVFSRDQNRATRSFSATTAVAALATFALGAYALLGDMRVAAAAAVAIAGVLLVREELHEWVSRITATELQSGLALLAMTFLVLPILPDRAVGPLQGINPREIWLIAIALAAVSFAGYVAVRIFGERWGVLAAGAAGGVVSSTAVTFTNARRAAAREGSPKVLAAGSVLATAISYVRVIALVAVLSPSLLRQVTAPLAVAAVVALGFSVVCRGSSRERGDPVEFRNPFAFWPVIGMTLLMGLMILFGRWIYAELGAVGAISGAATMGLFDVDAMVVSMARLDSGTVSAGTAALAILVGVASNTITKVAIGTVLGRGAFAARVALASAACIVAGGLAFVLVMRLTG